MENKKLLFLNENKSFHLNEISLTPIKNYVYYVLIIFIVHFKSNLICSITLIFKSSVNWCMCYISFYDFFFFECRLSVIFL